MRGLFEKSPHAPKNFLGNMFIAREAGLQDSSSTDVQSGEVRRERQD